MFVRLITSKPAFTAAALAMLLPTAGRAGTDPQPPTAAPVVAPVEHFDVFEYRVNGNTVIEQRDIESAVYPFLGPDKTLDTVEEARKALEKAYRDHGYGTVFVDIPEQTVNGGLVRLHVTEGKLDRVRVTGARYVSSGRIVAALPALESGSVLHLGEFQKQLAAVNSLSPDTVVTPVLRAGRAPGTVDAELKVQDKLPLHASLEVNNRYSADTTETRANFNLGYDNLFQKNHRISLQYQTAPEQPKEARVIAGTYVAPVNDGHDLLAAYIVDTNSDVATVGTLGVLGKGRIYGLRYIRPLPQIRSLGHSVTFGLDYKDFKEDVQISAETGVVTPIDYFNWSLAYGGNVQQASGRTAYSLSANFGMRGLGNDSAEFADKRFKGRPNYFYLRGDVQHDHAFLWGTQLSGRIAMQVAAEPVISNEQFAIGGATSVRGYLESQELGDYGYSASLEWRTSGLGPWIGEWAKTSYVFGFADAGSVWIIDPLPDQAASQDLASVGVGLRLAAFDGLNAALDWAYPIVDSGRVASGDSRIHFQVGYGF